MITELSTGALCPENLSPDQLRCAVRALLQKQAELQSQLKSSENRNVLLLAWGMGLQKHLEKSETDKEKLKLQVEGLKQGQGKHKSEKLIPEKRKELGMPDVEKKKRRVKKGERKKGGGRGPLPTHLPVFTEVIDVPPEEREGLVYLGSKTTDQLGCEPRRFYIRRIEQRMYGPEGCKNPTVIAPLPPQVIPKAAVSVSFVVHVIISKYVDHIPLYRQKMIDERSGVVVERNQRCRYVEDVSVLLESVCEQLRLLILTGRYIHVDEAFTKVLDPKRRGKARVAFMWGYYSPQMQAVYMKFSRERDHENILEFFPQDWSGDVHTDGYSAYPCAFEKRPGIVQFECVNHLRRYVLEAAECGQKEAVPLLDDLGELYELETAAELFTPEQRGLFRHTNAKPVLERLKAEFHRLKAREKPVGTPDGETKGPPLLGKLRTAVNYAVNRWEQLSRYAEIGNGHICIDQNPIERQWRPQKVGQRNYLFIGHPNAGWHAAVIYSVVSTCRLIGVDPEEYLTWVLPKLAASPKTGTAKTAAAKGLLPHDFRALKLAQAEAAKQRPPLARACSTRPPGGTHIPAGRATTATPTHLRLD